MGTRPSSKTAEKYIENHIHFIFLNHLNFKVNFLFKLVNKFFDFPGMVRIRNSSKISIEECFKTSIFRILQSFKLGSLKKGKQFWDSRKMGLSKKDRILLKWSKSIQQYPSIINFRAITKINFYVLISFAIRNISSGESKTSSRKGDPIWDRCVFWKNSLKCVPRNIIF